MLINFSGRAEVDGTHAFGVSSAAVEEIKPFWDEMQTTIDVWAGMNFGWGGAPANYAFTFEMPAHDVIDLRIIHTFTPENPPTGIQNIARNFTAMLIFFFTSVGLWIYVIRRRIDCCDIG